MNKTDNAGTLSKVKKQNSTHISLTIEHSKRGKSLKRENVHFEERNKVILDFMAAKPLKKVETGPCLPLSGDSLLMSGS